MFRRLCGITNDGGSSDVLPLEALNMVLDCLFYLNQTLVEQVKLSILGLPTLLATDSGRRGRAFQFFHSPVSLCEYDSG